MACRSTKVGIMQIPQGLAYGALTSLNPVHGLYTSFFCGLAYVVFGTSKHLSVGTFAVVSLMIYSTIGQVEIELKQQQQDYRVGLGDKQALKVKVATALAFWCGCIQVFFSILGLGNISKYLPQPFLRGFTTGAAFHVFTSQIRHIFGIYYYSPKRHKVFKLIYVYSNIFQRINWINWTAFIMSISAIFVLVLVKFQINDRFRKQLRNIPLPIDFLVIIVGTAVTYYAQLNKKYDLAIVGQIPKGLPEASLPEFSLFLYVAKDAIVISIISFTISVSISDLYARKHKYKINSNKEFLALGMANVFGSFFKCFVSCGSLARSAVQESSNGKTQLVTIISSFVVLSVMLWFSYLLESLPKALLAAIIIVALISPFQQFKDICYYWKLDKIDCLIWILTFTSSVVLDVEYGLFIGIIAVLFFNTYRSQKLELQVVGQVKDFEIFKNVEKYQANPHRKCKIIRPNHSIIYVNCDFFRDSLNAIFPLKDSPLHPPTICENCASNYRCVSKCCSSYCHKFDQDTIRALNDKTHIDDVINVLILDCTNVQFIDDAGFQILAQCIADYQKNGNLLSMIAKKEFVHRDVYLTVRDAIQDLEQ